MSLNDTFRNYAIGAVAGVALFSAVLSGQTRSVNGRVLDSENMLPLDSAKVVLVNENTHKSLDSLLTTTNGNYQFYFIPTDVLTTPTLPVKPKLYPNYPNPFNPSTTIRYELPKNENVNLRIVNILGQEIFKQEYFLPAGMHEWNVEGLGASGVYIYQVSTKDHSEAKKMVLLDGGSGNVNVRLKESASTLMPLSKVQTDQYSVNASRRHFYPQSIAVPDQENSVIDFLMAYVPDTMSVSGPVTDKSTSALLDSVTLSFTALPSTNLGNATTDPFGWYSKTMTGRLEGKSIDIHASRNNYNPKDTVIAFMRNANVAIKLDRVVPGYSLNGTVFSEPSHTGLSGANVKIKKKDGTQLASTVSNPAYNVSYSTLDDSVDVAATAADHQDFTQRILSSKGTLNIPMQYIQSMHNFAFLLNAFDGAGYSLNGFDVVLTTIPSNHVYNSTLSNGKASFNIQNEADTLAVLTTTNPSLLKWAIIMPSTNNYFGVDNVAQSADRNTSPTVSLNALNAKDSLDVYLIPKYVPNPQKAGQQIAMDSIEAVTVINGQYSVTSKLSKFNGLDQVDFVLMNWYVPTGQKPDTSVYNRSINAINNVLKGFTLPGNNKKLLDIKPLVIIDSLGDPYWQNIKNRGYENIVYTTFDANLGNFEYIRPESQTIKYGYAVYYSGSPGQMMEENYQSFTACADYQGGAGGWIFGLSMPNYSVFGQNATTIMSLLKPGSNY